MPRATVPDRRTQVQDAHAGFPSRPGRAPVVRARAQLARLLWARSGERKLPSHTALDAALSALTEAELDWMFELSPLAPLYFLPTRRFVLALARQIRALSVRRVLEVCAGDGFLARALQSVAPDLEVIATDSGAWQKPEARMRNEERAALAGQAVPGLWLGPKVQRMDARRAIATYEPELVLACWLPPGALLDRLIRAPVPYVLEIGAGSGVTASAYSWRFAHEFLEGPLEQFARCRLDTRPDKKLHSRITLYFGAAHEEHAEERVRPGDFLWQFRPER